MSSTVHNLLVPRHVQTSVPCKSKEMQQKPSRPRAQRLNSRAFSPRLSPKLSRDFIIIFFLSLSSELIRKGFGEDLGSSRPKDRKFRTNLEAPPPPVVHRAPDALLNQPAPPSHIKTHNYPQSTQRRKVGCKCEI